MISNQLLLKTGADIPFNECQLLVHQPRVNEIALIGNDEDFFGIVDLINFSKDKLKEQDRLSLESFSDFNIFMTMMQNESAQMQKSKQILQSLLYILFPQSKSITLLPNSIVIIDEENEMHVIDENNFDIFKDIINSIFDMSRLKGKDTQYNPANDTAAKIAEKIKRGRARVAAQKKADGKVLDVFGRYASILSIGLKLDLNVILNYTVYQLFYSFDRFEKQEAYNTYLQAQLAGATGMKDVEHWMQ